MWWASTRSFQPSAAVLGYAGLGLYRPVPYMPVRTHGPGDSGLDRRRALATWEEVLCTLDKSCPTFHLPWYNAAPPPPTTSPLHSGCGLYISELLAGRLWWCPSLTPEQLTASPHKGVHVSWAARQIWEVAVTHKLAYMQHPLCTPSSPWHTV